METLERIIAEHLFFEGLDQDFTHQLVSCTSIREGMVAVEVSAPPRRPIVVTLGAGEILGWSWILPSHRWKYLARAVSQVRAIALDGKCRGEKRRRKPRPGFEVVKRFARIIEQRLDTTRLPLLDVCGVKR